MPVPEYIYDCKSCYRCVQECTKGIFSVVVNPEYRSLGDDYYTASLINSTWAQAQTGKIPVSGAGYRGPFSGYGFDSIWTDMSEIVRPTRDGIHGREYINTSVSLSRHPMRLLFCDEQRLNMDLPPIIEIPIPVVFQVPKFGTLSNTVIQSMAHAASELGTFLFVRAEHHQQSQEYSSCLVPCLNKSDLYNSFPAIDDIQIIELDYEDGIEKELDRLRSLKPGLCISIGIPLDSNAVNRSIEMTYAGADSLHFYGSERGLEVNSNKPRFLKDLIREIHLRLVDECIRDKINLVFSGGIALAEHMAKAIICGADAVAIDVPLLIALECRLCYKCIEGKSCPVQLNEIDLSWSKQRIINLMGAWHNQLIEVMGACGIREVRRLRGEVGRSLWFDDLERECFGPIFGTRETIGPG